MLAPGPEAYLSLNLINCIHHWPAWLMHARCSRFHVSGAPAPNLCCDNDTVPRMQLFIFASHPRTGTRAQGSCASEGKLWISNRAFQKGSRINLPAPFVLRQPLHTPLIVNCCAPPVSIHVCRPFVNVTAVRSESEIHILLETGHGASCQNTKTLRGGWKLQRKWSERIKATRSVLQILNAMLSEIQHYTDFSDEIQQPGGSVDVEGCG